MNNLNNNKYICINAFIKRRVENKNTVGNIFSGADETKIIKKSENISIIVGDMHLDVIEKNIQNKSNKDMLFYLWLSDNYDKLNLDKFDYIIIDTHSDFSIATKNAIKVSDAVISPMTPS